MKTHSKIVEAADGALHFASMDEQGESDSARRLPRWDSHFWRLRAGQKTWERPAPYRRGGACGARDAEFGGSRSFISKTLLA